MYILTQDKSKIINLGRIEAMEVTRSFGGKKDEKYVLMAAGMIIGGYPDEDTAKKTLVKILAAIENKLEVYELD